MSEESAVGFICDYDLRITLDELSRKKPNLLTTFANYLNEKQLYEKVLEAAVEKRILRSDIRLRVSKAPNRALYLVNEFRRKCCTVELLCECIRGYGLQELFGVLGIFEKMYVIRQTGACVLAKLGDKLVLSFIVEGHPSPSFKWFHNGVPIPVATEESFIISNFRKEMAGKYYCIAEQRILNLPLRTLISDDIECVLLVDQATIEENLPPEIICPENEDITFKIKANDTFAGIYEWFYEFTNIYRSNKNYLTIKNVVRGHEGKYRCVLINAAGETHSDICILKVGPPLLRPSVKLALLFGSCEYHHFSSLKTPAEDVKLLSACLKQLDFNVHCFTDLTLKETKEKLLEFFICIPEDAFVLFYLSGHGFELCNNKFFIPIDCPPSGTYTLDDCLSHQYIIKKIMNTKPLLLISILDMCLRGPDKDSNPQLYCENLKHHGYDKPAHLFFLEACATSDYQVAYERVSQKNGLYCRCLCKYIREDLPIDHIFNKAHADFVKRDNGHQSPQLKVVCAKNDFRLNMTPYRCNKLS